MQPAIPHLRLISLTWLLMLAISLSWNTASAQTDLLGSDSESSSELSEETAASAADLQSPAEVRALVSGLSDQEVRSLLLERLDAVAEAKSLDETALSTTSSNITRFVKSWVNAIGDSLHIAVVRLPLIVTGQIQSFQNFKDKRGWNGTAQVVSTFLLAIFIGFLGEKLVRHLTRHHVERNLASEEFDTFNGTFKILGLRLFFDLAALFTFFIVSGIVLGQLLKPMDRDLCNLIMFNMFIFPRIMIAVSRFLVAPNRPELRLVHTDDWTAKFIAHHSWGLFVLMGFAATIVPFNAMNGLAVGTTRLGFWLNLGVHLYIIYIAWHAREGLTTMLMGKQNDVTPMEARIARLYPYFLIFISVVVWLVIELLADLGKFTIIEGQPQTMTLLIFLFIPTMDTLIRVMVDNLITPMRGGGPIAERAYQSTKHSYLRIGRICVFGLLTVFLVDIWHINLDTMASDDVGATVATDFFRLLMILSCGYLIWEVVSLFFNRKLAAEDTAAGHDVSREDGGIGEGGGTGSSRLATILPLFRFTLQAVVIIMTVMTGLSNIGINATPLLAGAGVVGIAVGFGAQKLVSDVVSGIFFLIDDAFRAGEYVAIDDTVGTVEKISLRSMRLRHHRGGIHTIPYGEIPKLTNYSRDWVLMKLRFTVPYNADLKKIKNIFKKIGNDVVDLPQFSDDLLQPFKSQGVLEVNDVGIVVGGKFMAKPGTQFMMRKELYLRVQRAFDENGIQFARKEVRVKLDGDLADNHQLTDDEKKAIVGAATDAISEVSDAAPDLNKR